MFKTIDNAVFRYYSWGDRLPSVYQIGSDKLGWSTQFVPLGHSEYVPLFRLREYRSLVKFIEDPAPMDNPREDAKPAKPKKQIKLGSVCINSLGRVGVVTAFEDDTYYGFGLDGKGIWQSGKPKVLSRSLESYRKRVLAAGGTGGFLYAYPISND